MAAAGTVAAGAAADGVGALPLSGLDWASVSQVQQLGGPAGVLPATPLGTAARGGVVPGPVGDGALSLLTFAGETERATRKQFLVRADLVRHTHIPTGPLHASTGAFFMRRFPGEQSDISSRFVTGTAGESGYQ